MQALIDIETATNLHRALEEAALLMVVFLVPLSYVIAMIGHCCFHLQLHIVTKIQMDFHFKAGSDNIKTLSKGGSYAIDGGLFGYAVLCHNDNWTLLSLIDSYSL
jgi:hypothetical protein